MQETKPEQLMVLDIVMLNALTISSFKREKLILMVGLLLQLIQTLVLVNGDHAVLKWIFGKLIKFQQHSQHIHARTWDILDVLIQFYVVTKITDIEENVIKTDVILTHTELV